MMETKKRTKEEKRKGTLCETSGSDFTVMSPPVTFVLAGRYRRRFNSRCAANSLKTALNCDFQYLSKQAQTSF